MGESDVVNAFNDFFDRKDLHGIAYRRKQSRFSSQFLDIIVNSADLPHLAIEHKSFKTKSSNKLYFSQHFSKDTTGNQLESGHQIDRVEEFRKRSGMDVYLLVEVRRGAGNPKRAFFLSWERLILLYRDWKDDEGVAGFDIEWFEDKARELPRNEGEIDGYQVSPFYPSQD